MTQLFTWEEGRRASPSRGGKEGGFSSEKEIENQINTEKGKEKERYSYSEGKRWLTSKKEKERDEALISQEIANFYPRNKREVIRRLNPTI